jgi:catechol 2,3-dioxygenase-like lactoylglutathione lyase family enzyme
MAETIRFEGLSLPVSDVARSIEFYRLLGFEVEVSRPLFALLRLGEGTLGLLKQDLSRWAKEARENTHLELSTDHLDVLYEELQARGMHFHEPPHDEPWERAMATHDPDGYTVEIAQGRRGHNAPGE